MATFEQIQITLTASDLSKTITVPVFAEIVAPGLALVPDLGGFAYPDEIQYAGGFTLTHVGSGSSVAGPGPSVGYCISCTREFAKVAVSSGIDWTQSMDELQAGIKAATEANEAFKRAYAEMSVCGGTNCGDAYYADEY